MKEFFDNVKGFVVWCGLPILLILALFCLGAWAGFDNGRRQGQIDQLKADLAAARSAKP